VPAHLAATSSARFRPSHRSLVLHCMHERTCLLYVQPSLDDRAIFASSISIPLRCAPLNLFGCCLKCAIGLHITKKMMIQKTYSKSQK
jgi:hypothetical protein